MAQHSQAVMTTSRKNPGLVEGYNKNIAYVVQRLNIHTKRLIFYFSNDMCQKSYSFLMTHT